MLAPGQLGAGLSRTLLVASLWRQTAKARQVAEAKNADAGEGGEQRRSRPIDVEEGREAWQLGHYIGRLPIQQDHPGDLVRVAAGEDLHVWASRRMTHEDVWSRDMSSIQQGVQVGGGADAILRTRRGVAKSSTRAVVDAPPGIACNGGRDPPPVG